MISHKIKNYTIGGLLLLLLISLSVNIYQNRLRKDDKFYAELAKANSNTIIAGNEAIIAQKDIAIESERKQRRLDSLKTSDEKKALNVKLARYEKKLSTLPKTVPYSPDSAMVDSLRVAFFLKDSTIDTQKLKIGLLERDINAQFESFGREIKDLQTQRAAQVENTNQLQIQLVDEQGKTRKEVRKKKFFRTLSIIGAGAIGILLLKPN